MYDGVLKCLRVCVCVMIYLMVKSLAAGGAAESSRQIEACMTVYSCVCVCVS